MENLPTFYDTVLFQAKATCFRAARAYRDSTTPTQLSKWPRVLQPVAGTLLAESQSPLWDHRAPHAEKVLQAGKVQNLRIASRELDGCIVPANQVFSFWKQIGYPGRSKGYVEGRELRQGCIIPTIAGGLCQLSNALYDTALKAGFSIQERHAHTQIIPGSLAEEGRDATVFWNYVDLRFTSNRPYQIRSTMTADNLLLQFWTCDEA